MRVVLTVRGRLGRLAAGALGRAAVEVHDDRTVIATEVVDQAALFGLLDRVQDLGLDLISVDTGDDASA